MTKYMVSEMWCMTDGRTDEQTEKVTQIEVSVPSKKLN